MLVPASGASFSRLRMPVNAGKMPAQGIRELPGGVDRCRRCNYSMSATWNRPEDFGERIMTLTGLLPPRRRRFRCASARSWPPAGCCGARRSSLCRNTAWPTSPSRTSPRRRRCRRARSSTTSRPRRPCFSAANRTGPPGCVRRIATSAPGQPAIDALRTVLAADAEARADELRSLGGDPADWVRRMKMARSDPQVRAAHAAQMAMIERAIADGTRRPARRRSRQRPLPAGARRRLCWHLPRLHGVLGRLRRRGPAWPARRAGVPRTRGGPAGRQRLPGHSGNRTGQNVTDRRDR